jgi:hypothetical protein
MVSTEGAFPPPRMNSVPCSQGLRLRDLIEEVSVADLELAQQFREILRVHDEQHFQHFQRSRVVDQSSLDDHEIITAGRQTNLAVLTKEPLGSLLANDLARFGLQVFIPEEHTTRGRVAHSQQCQERVIATRVQVMHFVSLAERGRESEL